MQLILNMEIERYTLATGETAIVGFARSWKPWGLFFILVRGDPELLAGLGGELGDAADLPIGGGNVDLIAIAMLVVMGARSRASPVVYKTMERVEFAEGRRRPHLPRHRAGRRHQRLRVLRRPQGGDRRRLGLRARRRRRPGRARLRGRGGVNNLCQSNWIRDKGFGMGKHIPHVVSPITGEDQAKPSTGYMVRPDDENLDRFNQWWKVANKEQFYFFFCQGSDRRSWSSRCWPTDRCSARTSARARLRRGRGEHRSRRQIGTVVRDGVLGHRRGVAVRRLARDPRLRRPRLADVIKTLYARESRRITESRIYFGFVWGEIALGTIVLLSGFDQPLALLIVASSLNGVVMFLYSMLLIRLNRQGLPVPIRVGGVRLDAAVGHLSGVRRAVGGAAPGADLSAATAARPVSTPM